MVRPGLCRYPLTAQGLGVAPDIGAQDLGGVQQVGGGPCRDSAPTATAHARRAV
jgi:hypothetical protein